VPGCDHMTTMQAAVALPILTDWLLQQR
jgi:hypothetical protein